MLKKCYIAIIADDKTGIVKGSVMVRNWVWISPIKFHQKLTDMLNEGQCIVSFQRVK